MYLYEMHQHTSGCSACAVVTPQEMVKAVKESGFAGVVLTNHFYNGNSAVDRNLPWEDFCKRYQDEYLLAKEAGEKIGIDVFYGLEEGVGGGKEVLIYGIEPDLMARHPELISGDINNISRVVRDAGGVIVQAHPFREKFYIPNPNELLPPQCLDGYEVYNKGNTKEENAKAVALAKQFGKFMTAGSDCHNDRSSGRFGIACKNKIKTEKDLVQVLKNGDYELIYNED